MANHEITVNAWSQEVSTSVEILTALCRIAGYDFQLARDAHDNPCTETIKMVEMIVCYVDSPLNFTWQGCKIWQAICDKESARLSQEFEV